MGDGLIHLAYDVGPGVGLGHRRRMEALAAALAGLGVEASAGELGEAPVDADVAVIDSYRVRADGRAVRARRTAAVDELGRDLAVDLVIDPAPAPTGAAPTGAAPGPAPDGVVGRDSTRAGRVLRGLEYALLDPALRDLRVPDPDPGAPATTVLVASGGADSESLGSRVAGELATELPDVRVRLAVGPWSAPDVPPGVEPVRREGGLAPDLAGADVVVCSSGVTLLEALALGRPVVAFVTAGNQRRYHAGLVARGAVVGAEPGTAVAEAARLVGDGAARRRLSAAARQAVDGRGAERVAEAVAGLL